jgi:hypothetical protein
MESRDKVKYRETLLVIVLGFSVLYLILGRNWMLYTALGLGIAGMLSAPLNRWIHMAWLFTGEKPYCRNIQERHHASENPFRKCLSSKGPPL